MKKSISVIIPLFMLFLLINVAPVHAASVQLDDGNLHLSADYPVVLTCIIPSHGGRCSINSSTRIWHDYEESVTLVISNLSVEGSEPLVLTDIEPQEQTSVSMIYKRRPTEGVLSMAKGSNLIFVDVYKAGEMIDSTSSSFSLMARYKKDY